jgi:hypothetical protein
MAGFSEPLGFTQAENFLTNVARKTLLQGVSYKSSVEVLEHMICNFKKSQHHFHVEHPVITMKILSI